MPQRCWYGDSATYTPNNVHFNDQQSPFVTLFMPKLHVVVDTSELRSENASMTTSAIVANISTLITISDSTPPPLVPRLPLQKKSHHHNQSPPLSTSPRPPHLFGCSSWSARVNRALLDGRGGTQGVVSVQHMSA